MRDNRAMPTRVPMSEDTPERIVDVDVGDEMRGSFLEYAYSVIYARALPDARDGLKPVQRRIIYQAGEMGLRPDRGHVKSARLVGEVMGRLHPHGESAIYDALVRMAQPFSLRLPFIDGHGNFGSLDDGPAAMRYTECRLAPAALPMIEGIHENTVDFVGNYDGREEEPTVLPAAIPSLLVNGATGIAVGMATNIAPHNLVEVINAARHLLTHPSASVDELMRFVPGPDLPTGARIVGLDGIREAYATGRGSFRIRATATFEQVTPRRRGIVISELPYNVGVERVMQRIKDLHSAKKIVGISGMTDLTDGDQGLRLLIEVKSGIDPEALLEQLYRMTPLEEQFSINAVALVDGAPATLGLRQMLEVFLAHRREVVRRRSEFRRAKAADRLHLVDGLLIAILDIDEVIAVIRSSDDAAEAKSRLMSIFELTDAQTTYILDMPLRRLTKYSRIELEAERDSLRATIAELTRLLEDSAVLTAAVSDELAEVAANHGTARRTVLLEEAARPTSRAGQMSLELADEPCVVVLSATGLIARVGMPEGPVKANRGSHSALQTALTTSTRSDFGVITNTGRLVRMPVVDLPSMPATASAPNLDGGTDAAAFAHLPDGERVVGVVSLDDRGFALGTAAGVVKRVAPDTPANKADWSVITLKDGDEVIASAVCDDDDDLVFITSAGSLLHFPADLVRPQGRNAGGVAGIKLPAGARVVAFAVADEDSDLVLTVAVGARGAKSAKVTALSEYPAKGRATAGVRVQRLLSGERELLLAAVGPAPAACSSAGVNIVLPDLDSRRDGSGVSVPTRLAAVGGGARVFRPTA